MTAAHDEWVRKRLRQTRRLRAKGTFAKYADDPVGFCTEVLHLQMWDRAEEIALSVRDNDRTMVIAGHKVSKSTMDVALALWWCAAAHPARGTRSILTAPSGHQVKNILWAELTNRLDWLEENHPRIREQLGGELPLDPTTGWKLACGSEILGVTTNKPERLAGISGQWLLIIIDEATGYADELFNALQGNEAGGAKLLASTNPTRPQGWCYEGSTDGEWNVVWISSTESPNVRAGKKVIPGLATVGWVERMQRICGPDYENNPEYQIRVLGVFPDRVENQIVSMNALRDAQKRWDNDDSAEFAPLVIGLDPARYGVDECVSQPVRGLYAYPPLILGGAVDGKQIADAVVQQVRRIRRPQDRPVMVVVDGASSGATAVDQLRYHEATHNGEIQVIVHEGFREAENNVRFANLRTEVWFKLDEWLRDGGRVQPSKDLKKECLAGLYSFDSKSRNQMEPKDKMKKRLKKSPNRADALTLAVSTRPPAEPGYDAGDDEDRGRGREQWM